MAEKQRDKSRPGLTWRVVRWLAVGILALLAAVIVIFTTTPGGWLIALTLNRLGSGPSQSVEIDSIGGRIFESESSH